LAKVAAFALNAAGGCAHQRCKHAMLVRGAVPGASVVNRAA